MPDLTWRKSSRSGGGGCVEAAPVDAQPTPSLRETLIAALLASWVDQDLPSSQTMAAEAAGRDVDTLLAAIEAHPVLEIRPYYPTQDAYDAACRALEKHRERADHAEANVTRLQNRIAALEANGAELLARTEHAEDAAQLHRERADRWRRARDTARRERDEARHERDELQRRLTAKDAVERGLNQDRETWRSRAEPAEATIERIRALRDQWALASTSPDDSPDSGTRTATYAAVVSHLDAALDGGE